MMILHIADCLKKRLAGPLHFLFGRRRSLIAAALFCTVILPAVAMEESNAIIVALTEGSAEQLENSAKYAGAEVSIEPDKPEYFLGENVLLHWSIRNGGDTPFKISVGGDGRTPDANRAIRFKIEAIETEGQAAVDPYPQPNNFGGLGGDPTLEPGQDFYHDLQLMRYREISSPGNYTIKVYHDLGWEKRGFRGDAELQSDIPKSDCVAPVASTTVRFLMPSAEQAQQVVNTILAMPKDPGRHWGKKGETFPDFALLRYQVYLPIMKELVQKGDLRGLDAIGAMAFPEATVALREFMQHPETAVATKAGQLMLSRTPHPHDRVPSRRNYLVERAWNTELKKTVMVAAWQLMMCDEREKNIQGARFVQAFGTQEDLPAFIVAMDRLLVAYQKDPHEQEMYLRRSNVSEILPQVSLELIRRGAQPPISATTPGSAVAWLVALGSDKDFRPEGWADTARNLIQHEIPFVREVALRNLPLPLDEKTIPLVAAAIKDLCLPVQGAACHLATKAKLNVFAAPLAEVLASTKNRWVLDAAFHAAKECSLENDRRLEICVDRMKPRTNDWNLFVLQLLVDGTFKSNGSSARDDDNWAPFLPQLKAAWHDFINAHRQELRAGKQFPITAPPLTPAMLPPNFQLRMNGQIWPPDATR